MAVLAYVWLGFALILLFVALRGRVSFQRQPPMPPAQPIDTTVRTGSRQQVVVPLVDLPAGELLVADLVDLRAASAVVSEFPALRAAEATPGGNLLVGYYEKTADVEGLFALVDLRADRPIAVGSLSPQSPVGYPLDPLRVDRMTIEVPAEPTIHQHLRPGDRIDVMAVAGGSALGMVVREARVVAINQVTAEGSGLGGQGAEPYRGGRFEAARRKRLRMQAMQRQQQAAGATEDQPPEEAEPPAEEPAAAVEPAPEEEEREGRTLTLQVTPREAQALAAVHRISGVRLEFALHPRR